MYQSLELIKNMKGRIEAKNLKKGVMFKLVFY